MQVHMITSETAKVPANRDSVVEIAFKEVNYVDINNNFACSAKFK